MPTIFADKAFQNHYKDWSKQLEKDSQVLAVDTVINDILLRLNPQDTVKADTREWTPKDLKGLEIFANFTALFFDSHSIASDQAKKLTEVISEQLPTNNATWEVAVFRDNIKNQLLAAEKMDESIPSIKLNRIDSKIESLQGELKNEQTNLLDIEKWKHRRKTIAKGVAIGGTIAAIGLGIALGAVFFWPLAVVGLLPLVFLYAGVGASLMDGSSDSSKSKYSSLEKSRELKNEINRLIALRNLAYEEAFRNLINKIDPSRLDEILSDEDQAIALLELNENEEAVRELQSRRENATKALEDQKATTKPSEELRKLNPLNDEILERLDKIKELREILKLPPSELDV